MDNKTNVIVFIDEDTIDIEEFDKGDIYDPDEGELSDKDDGGM